MLWTSEPRSDAAGTVSNRPNKGGGSAGTTRDTFELVAQAERYGARVALFGRKIYFAEDSVALVQFMRRVVQSELSPNEAVKAYKALAEKNGMTAAQLALAWCDNVDGVTSTIIGATTMAQLKDDIDAFDIELSDELKAEIATIHRQYPMPF